MCPLLQISHTLAPKGKGYAPPTPAARQFLWLRQQEWRNQSIHCPHWAQKAHRSVTELQPPPWNAVVSTGGIARGNYCCVGNWSITICARVSQHPLCAPFRSEMVMVIQATSRLQHSAFPRHIFSSLTWSKQEIGVKHGLPCSCSTAQGAASCEHLVLLQ